MRAADRMKLRVKRRRNSSLSENKRLRRFRRKVANIDVAQIFPVSPQKSCTSIKINSKILLVAYVQFDCCFEFHIRPPKSTRATLLNPLGRPLHKLELSLGRGVPGDHQSLLV